MEKNSIVALAITLAVGVILTGSLLVPAINDYEESTYEHYTYAGGYMASSLGDADTVIEADLELSSNTYTVAINDKDVTSLIPNNGNQPILMWSEGFIQVSGTNGTDGVLKAYFYDETSSSNKAISNATHIQVSTAEGVLTAVLTVNGTDTTYTSEYEWIGYVDQDGEQKMILRNTTQPIYFSDVNQIHVAGWTQNTVVSSVGEELTITGSVTGTVAITSTEVIDGVYSTLTTDMDYTINDTAWNPLYLVIPGDVAVQTEGTEGYVSLFAVIPVLIMIGLLVTGVSSFVRNRD